MAILPSDGFKVSFTVGYDYGNIGKQVYVLEGLEEFISEISPARTFCSLDDLSYLKENNLIKGGDLNNAIVFVENGKSNNTEKIIKDFSLDTSNLSFNGNILNNKELRFKNEPVRHKILDLIGDFSSPIIF